MGNKIKQLSEEDLKLAVKNTLDNPLYKKWDKVCVLSNGHVYHQDKELSAKKRADELGIEVKFFTRTEIDQWAKEKVDLLRKEAEKIQKQKEAAQKKEQEQKEKEAAEETAKELEVKAAADKVADEKAKAAAEPKKTTTQKSK